MKFFFSSSLKRKGAVGHVLVENFKIWIKRVNKVDYFHVWLSWNIINLIEIYHFGPKRSSFHFRSISMIIKILWSFQWKCFFTFFVKKGFCVKSEFIRFFSSFGMLISGAKWWMDIIISGLVLENFILCM